MSIKLERTTASTATIIPSARRGRDQIAESREPDSGLSEPRKARGGRGSAQRTCSRQNPLCDRSRVPIRFSAPKTHALVSQWNQYAIVYASSFRSSNLSSVGHRMHFPRRRYYSHFSSRVMKIAATFSPGVFRFKRNVASWTHGTVALLAVCPLVVPGRGEDWRHRLRAPRLNI